MQTLIRAPGGTARQEVAVSEIKIPDLRPFALFHPNARWVRAIPRYYRDLCRLLFSARIDKDFPDRIWIPDLWHAAMQLHGDERETLLDAWHLGHDLVTALGYTDGPFCFVGPLKTPGRLFIRGA